MANKKLDRRDFAVHVSATAISLAAAAKLSMANEPSAESPGSAALSEEQVLIERIKLTLEMISRSYPHELLTEDVFKELASQVAGNLARSKVLASFPLKNGDAPAGIYFAGETFSSQ